MKKICIRCKKTKSLEDFHKDVSKKDDRRTECKSCANARVKIYYTENRQKLLKYQKKYNIENKQKISKYQQKYHVENKHRRQEYDKKYRANSKQRISEINKKYNETEKGRLTHAKYAKSDKGRLTRIRAKHNRRANEANTSKDFTIKDEKLILSLQNYKCIWPGCGKYFDEIIPTLDHIKPVSKGGSLVIDNVQYLCGKHNGEKYTQEIDLRSDIHKQIINQLF